MNIPIFVPHQGCPHNCAFCNQNSITGTDGIPSEAEMRHTIESYLSGGKTGTIAFFGGSFTGIDEGVQRSCLSVAKEYLDDGRICGIRLSTRPDYIDENRLALLSEYGVTNIELGAQSMDDEVLRLSRRGHDANAVRRAAGLIKENGFKLGLQMMTGLPADTAEKSLETAREFVALGADETRIYPTLVMENTLLAKMYREGKYVPWEIELTVELCARLSDIFRRGGVKVLRIGLSDNIELKDGCIAGPYHPAMGELVTGRCERKRLESRIENGRLDVVAPKKYISKIIGNKRCNAEYFKALGVEFNVSEGEKLTVNGKEADELRI